jgi:hypothetical protein
MLCAIKSAIRQDMTGLQLQYVAGHQDQTKAFHKLTLLAQLNVEADGWLPGTNESMGTTAPKYR